jgi:WD40 repeat protein
MRSSFFCLLILLNTFLSYTQQLVPVLSIPHAADITHMQVSADGKYLVSVDKDSTAKIWFTKDKLLLCDIELDGKKIVSADFSPVHNTEIILATARSIITYNFKEQKKISEYFIDFPIYKIFTSLMGQSLLIFSSDYKNEIALFDLKEQLIINKVFVKYKVGLWFYFKRYFEDDNFIVSNDLNKVFLIDEQYKPVLLSLNINKSSATYNLIQLSVRPLKYFEFSKDSKVLVLSAVYPYSVSFFDAVTGNKIDSAGISDTIKIKQRKKDFIGFETNNIVYKNSTKKKELLEFYKNLNTIKVLSNPIIYQENSGSYLQIFSDKKDRFCLWDLKKQIPALSLYQQKGVLEVRVSNGRLLASKNNRLELWNIPSQKKLVTLLCAENYNHFFSGVDLSDSGNFLTAVGGNIWYCAGLHNLKNNLIDIEGLHTDSLMQSASLNILKKYNIHIDKATGSVGAVSFSVINSNTDPVEIARFINDTSIIYRDFNLNIQVTDINNNSLINFSHAGYRLSSDKKLIAFLNKETTDFALYDILKNKTLCSNKLNSLDATIKDIQDFYFLNDNRNIAFLQGNNIYLFDCISGKLIKKIYLPDIIIRYDYENLFSNRRENFDNKKYYFDDNNRLLIGSQLKDVSSKKSEYHNGNSKPEVKDNNTGYAEFVHNNDDNPDTVFKRQITFYEKDNYKNNFSLFEDGFNYYEKCIVYDTSFLFIPYKTNIVRYNIKQKKVDLYFKGHTATINSLLLSNDKKYLYSAAKDNTVRIWDASNGNLLNSIYIIDSADYISILKTGYYRCAQSIAKKLYYLNKNLGIINFSQLDIKYNRPDKILEALGNTDTALINSYKKAYEKRIKKLGIDTSSFREGFTAPEADFTNRDDAEFKQTNNTVKLQVHGIDSSYNLDRFNIWINDVPLYGLKGVNIRYKNKNVFDTTVTVALSEGDNKIETSVVNVNGIESYRSPLYIKYTPAQPEKEKIYFLGIGIDRFADSANNLQWSAKDVRDLAIHLKEKYRNAIETDTLFNENVTVSNVKALKEKLQQTSVNDKVIVAYSGHGLLSKDYDYYLSTYNINFQQPEQNGLPYDELENLLDSIPARKKLMLIDACHSGEIDKDEMQQYTAFENKQDSVKGIILKPKDSSRIGMKNSFELMQELFVNVGKSTGATIISAASGTQFAMEKSDLKNGVFTYSILEYMQQHAHATLSELRQYVNNRVPQLTQGLQQPTSRSETIDVDWNVW